MCILYVRAGRRKSHLCCHSVFLRPNTQICRVSVGGVSVATHFRIHELGPANLCSVLKVNLLGDGREMQDLGDTLLLCRCILGACGLPGQATASLAEV